MKNLRQMGDAGHTVTSEAAMRASASHPARGCRVAPGYEHSKLTTLPPDAVAGAAGCGDPVGRCELQEGDVVLDLGSGTGIDLILAARRVGPSGRVVGVDALPEMVTAARATADLCGVGNIEVRRARIEALPIAPSSVDWVVANCAINHAKDKPRVFSEIARVLKAGARMRIADVFTHGLPAGLDADPALEASCVARATPESEYIVALAKAGFVDFAVGGRYVYDQSELAAMVTSVTPPPAPGHQASDLAAALVGGVWRAYVFARKPAGKRRLPDCLIEVSGGQRTVGIQKGARRHDDPRRTTEADPRLRSSHAEDQRESGLDSWWTSDRLDALGWAAIFIWGAVMVLATYTDFSGDFSWWDGWGVFFVGAGVVVLVESGARLFLSEYRAKLSWTFVWGMIFLSIGLGTLFGSAWLALALVAVAFVILAGALRGTT